MLSTESGGDPRTSGEVAQQAAVAAGDFRADDYDPADHNRCIFAEKMFK